MTTVTVHPDVGVGDLDLRTRIGRVWVEGVVGNSPGPLKTIPETERLLETSVPMVTFGSITRTGRMGNALPNFWEDERGYITQNAVGLTNFGLDEYLPQITDLVGKAKAKGKHLIVSIAGEVMDEYLEMAEALSHLDISLELNLSCPNVDLEGEMWAFDPPSTGRLIYRVRRVFSGNLIVKLNYHPSGLFIKEMSRVVNGEGIVDAVALINTVGNTLIIDPEKLQPRISRDFGGLSGASILPIALGTIFRWREYLEPQIDIIGEGGINSGFDILSMFVAGASVCRVGSAYSRRRLRVFGELTLEFVEEMNTRGYTSLAQIPRMRDLPPLPAWQPV